jgi:hypothetical protein
MNKELSSEIQGEIIMLSHLLQGKFGENEIKEVEDFVSKEAIEAYKRIMLQESKLKSV